MGATLDYQTQIRSRLGPVLFKIIMQSTIKCVPIFTDVIEYNGFSKNVLIPNCHFM